MNPYEVLYETVSENGYVNRPWNIIMICQLNDVRYEKDMNEYELLLLKCMNKLLIDSGTVESIRMH